MTPPAPTVLEDSLRRDVAILSTLAHLHCTTIPQLHALCFPYHTLATARLSLHYLAQAGFIAHTPWQVRCGSREGGQIWSLTAKGNDFSSGMCRTSRQSHGSISRARIALSNRRNGASASSSAHFLCA